MLDGKKGKSSGISAIDELYKSYMDEKNDNYPMLKEANIYDPLRLGIDTTLFEENF